MAPEFFAFDNIIRQMNYLQDHDPGSILFLFEHIPHNEKENIEELKAHKYYVRMFELTTGKREEYFKIFLDYPQLYLYYIASNHSDPTAMKWYKKLYNELRTDDLGNKIYP